MAAEPAAGGAADGMLQRNNSLQDKAAAYAMPCHAPPHLALCSTRSKTNRQRFGAVGAVRANVAAAARSPDRDLQLSFAARNRSCLGAASRTHKASRRRRRLRTSPPWALVPNRRAAIPWRPGHPSHCRCRRCGLRSPRPRPPPASCVGGGREAGYAKRNVWVKFWVNHKDFGVNRISSRAMTARRASPPTCGCRVRERGGPARQCAVPLL